MRSSHLKSWSVTQNLHQAILVVSTLLGSWLGMQAAHEAGHVLGALLTGGEIATVVLHPLAISYTELIDNPHLLVVVWAVLNEDPGIARWPACDWDARR